MNIAMISAWHVHAHDYAKQIMNNKNCEITAIWDEDVERGNKWAQELNCKFYEDYDMLSQDNSIDGVVIASPTSMHTDLIMKAANAKKHIFTEKVLALQVEDCTKIKQAIEKNNVIFTISFPHKCRNDLIAAKNIAGSGEIGQLTYARVRNVHNGSINDWLPQHFYNKEQCGGGAMIDLGAHSMYLLEWILGKPKSITSTFTNVTNRPVEDNAVCVIEFNNGAIGVSETGFVSSYNPFTLEISGTKGAILVRNGVSYASEKTEGKWVNMEDLPDSLPTPIQQWIDSILNGTKPYFGIDDAISLTEIMEAAYQSFESGKKIEL